MSDTTASLSRKIGTAGGVIKSLRCAQRFRPRPP